MQQTTSAAILELKSCLSVVRSLPEAEPVRENMPVDLRDATLDQMMDSSKVTPEQTAAIKATHPKLTECRKTALDKIAAVMPSIAAILADEMQKRDADLIELLERKITWGAYVTKGKETGAATGKQITEEYQKIAAGLERSHEAELARRQAAANAMTQYFQTQEMINAVNRPVMTNCTGFGNSVNCISQ